MNARVADTSNLLVPGSVLLLLPRLVPLIGLNGAIVLQQVRYLTAPPRGASDHEGRRWVRLSYAEWRANHFPFWQIDTVKRAFQGLEEEGLLVAERLHAPLRDQTKSYAIDYARLADLDRAYRAATEGTTRLRAGRRRRSAGADDQSLPASNLLLDDNPLVIIPRLAVLIGLDEALVLQQVRYWLADNRHPRLHEGHRWVRFTQQGWAQQIPRSLRTLGTVFRKLESQGLLTATTRLNTVPGDQTKWYTIDFERLRALDANAAPAPPPPASGNPTTPSTSPDTAPEGNSAPVQSVKMRAAGDAPPIGRAAPARRAEVAPPIGKSASHQSAIPPTPAGNVATPQSATSPPCRQGTETRTEINEQETQQHGRTRPSSADPPHAPDGVVTDRSLRSIGDEAATGLPEESAADVRTVVKALVDRGVTGAVAIRLAARFPERVARQTEVYDWLCEERPGDGRLTPGRLRRMIEEDWTLPSDFVPAAERARRVAAAAAAEESRPQPEIGRQTLREREYATRLAMVDVTRDEQGSWRIILERMERRGGGARFFAGTLFREPRGGDPAVVIVRDRRAIEAFDTPAGRAAFDELARRLAERYPTAAWPNPSLVPVVVLYDELARALTGAGPTGSGAEPNATDEAPGPGPAEGVGPG